MKKIAIIGATNVGKSTLFNKICGKNISITFDQEDTTVDYITYTIDNNIIIDTCGIYKPQDLNEFILSSDIFLYVFDGRQKPTDLDINICKFLQKQKKKFYLIGNKTESNHVPENQTRAIIYDKLFWTSSEHSIGIDDLMYDLEIPYLGNIKKTLPLIAILGRANSGKSTLMNCLLGYDRSKVEDKIGTTRDNIIETAETVYHSFHFMDTAGYRKSDETLEYITKKRRENSLMNIDGAILLLDGQVGLTKIDKQILDEVLFHAKFIIIAINKIDILTDDPLKDFGYFHVPEWIPIVKTCAKENELGKLKRMIDLCYVNSQKNISTKELNRIFHENEGKFRDIRNKQVKIKYAFQKKSSHMIISYFASFKLDKNSESFTKKLIASHFDLKGVNIMLEFLQKKPANWMIG